MPLTVPKNALKARFERPPTKNKINAEIITATSSAAIIGS
jgi:hypothetical protein